MLTAIAIGAGVVVVALVAWGHFEAGWVQLRRLELPLEGLPPELEGLRIVHLSDFHLGFPSRGVSAVRNAVEWTRERQPELTLVSGDLLSNPRGEALLRELMRKLPNCYAVLGNHDYADSRDPFSRHSPVADLAPATLLRDDQVTLELRGRRVQVVGVDPRTYRRGRSDPTGRADPEADLRILLCHFPNIVRHLRTGVFDLVLAGHLHAGQIALPFPGGRVPLAHPTWRHVRGLRRAAGGVLHVSAGLGTTFVPFRFLARPEATEMVLSRRPSSEPTT